MVILQCFSDPSRFYSRGEDGREHGDVLLECSSLLWLEQFLSLGVVDSFRLLSDEPFRVASHPELLEQSVQDGYEGCFRRCASECPDDLPPQTIQITGQADAECSPGPIS